MSCKRTPSSPAWRDTSAQGRFKCAAGLFLAVPTLSPAEVLPHSLAHARPGEAGPRSTAAAALAMWRLRTFHKPLRGVRDSRCTGGADMAVRRHVFVLVAICSGLALALIALLAMALSTSDHSARRIAAISDRLAVLNQLSASAGNYGEQAAETLLFGRGRDEDLANVRIDMERELARLTQATRTEITTLDDMDEVANELPDIEGARRLVELYHAIDAAMNTVLSMRRSGSSESNSAYQSTVSFRLANELQPVLSSAVDGENAKLAAEVGKAETSRSYFVIAAGAIGVLGL